MTYSFSDWKAGKPLPKDDWDAADAVEDGWTGDHLVAFMRATAVPYEEWLKRRQAASSAADTDGPDARPTMRTEPPETPTNEGGKKAEQLAGPAPTRPAGSPVLNPRDPMSSARAMMEARIIEDSLPTLRHWRDSFYKWDGTYYREIDRAATEADIWRFLDQANSWNKDGDLEPFQPNRARVGDVSATLAALCNLPAYVEAPAWLADKEGSHADELTPVANGLLHLTSGILYPQHPPISI